MASSLGSHRNIVKCHGMDDRTPQAAILYELCEKGDMFPVASNDEPASDIDKIRQVKQYATAMAYFGKKTSCDFSANERLNVAMNFRQTGWNEIQKLFLLLVETFFSFLFSALIFRTFIRGVSV